MNGLAEIWPGLPGPGLRLVAHRHSPPRFVAEGCNVLRATPRSTSIAATISPDLDEPEEAARVVADALNAHLR